MALSSGVLAILAGGLANLVDLDQVSLQPGEARRYVRLFAREDYDAWLIAWSPGSAIGPHDHGGSRGAVRVVAGELSETFVDQGVADEARSRVVAAGETLQIPEHRIHEVWNAGPGTAISIHAYSPPLESMEFFDRATITVHEPERYRQTA